MNDKKNEELIAKLDKLCNESDTSLISDIQSYQNKHLRHMGQKYSRFMCQFEMYFSAIVNTGHTINYLDKKHWPSNRALQFVVASHALKQFYSAYTLLCNGAYEDAINILRSVYESLLRIVFVTIYPNEAYNIFKAQGQKGRQFNATELVKDLGLDWNNYRIMSSFTHSNQFRVVEAMTEIGRGGQKEAISLTYKKDDDMISVNINYMLFLITAFLKLFTEIFTVRYEAHKDKETIKKHLDLLNDYKEAASQTIKTHSSNKYWRQVGVDLDKIFELMIYMDSNPSADWKKQWAVIYGV